MRGLAEEEGWSGFSADAGDAGGSAAGLRFSIRLTVDDAI
jgi:hypothetical protein